MSAEDITYLRAHDLACKGMVAEALRILYQIIDIPNLDKDIRKWALGDIVQLDHHPKLNERAYMVLNGITH